MNYIINKNTTELASLIYEASIGKNIVFVCLGTCRVSGDAFGPLVGSIIKHVYNLKVPVLGDTHHNITSKNLYMYMNIINHLFPKHRVCIIDSSLGARKNIGIIKFKRFPLEPAKGALQQFPPIGDYSITAIVEDKSHLIGLQYVKKQFVLELAFTASKAIYEYINLKKFCSKNNM